MRVGVLALQGDVPEHRAALLAADPSTTVVDVLAPSDLERIEGLLLPGGESTTMSKLLRSSGLFTPLARRLCEGLPVLATCAGAILLAGRVDPAGGGETPEGFHRMDYLARRNDYGRQADSFEAPVEVDGIAGGPFPGVFIRAPRIAEVGPGVEPFARLGKEVVGVRQGNAIALAFHPELSGDARIHRLWLAQLDAGLGRPHTRSAANRSASPSSRKPARTASQ